MSSDPLHRPEGDEYAEWYDSLPVEDPADFCDLAKAVPMRFVEGVGFVEGDEALEVPTP